MMDPPICGSYDHSGRRHVNRRLQEESGPGAATTSAAHSPAPRAAISVNPTDIQAGQSASRTWQTNNATDVSIDGIGGAAASSVRQSYRLDHVSPGRQRFGGSQEATARLTVTQPPPPPPPDPEVTEEDLFNQTVKDVYFDYDKADLRGDQQAVVTADAGFLSQHTV